MDELIADVDAARRLARTIVSDLAMYHKAEVEKGIVEDTLFETLATIIEEGREHFGARVTPEFARTGLYEKSLVDLLLKPFAHVPSKIW